MKCNKKLSDVAEISVGFPFQSKLFNQKYEGFKLIRGKNVGKGFLHWGKDAMYYANVESINKNYIMRENDVVLAMDGNVVDNKSLVRKKDLPSFLVQRVARLRAKDGIDQLFLWYIVNTHQFEQYINGVKTGTTIQHISAKQIGGFRLDVPNLETQQKIVRILSALDQKIELNNRLIDLLYSLGDAIYEKIQNDNPRTITLKDISINYDKKRVPLSSRQREERRGKFPYYGATSILDYVDDYLFDGEYVLLGEDGTVMTNEGGAVLQYIWGKNWVNNHAHVLQGSKVSTEYLLFALRSVNVSALVTGAVQPKINQENMNKIKLSIGSEDKMSEVEESIKTIAAQIRNLTDGNKSLSDMRDTLLPKLMSGEVNLDKATLQ